MLDQEVVYSQVVLLDEVNFEQIMEVVNNENINESKNAKIDKDDEVPKQTNAVLLRVLDCLTNCSVCICNDHLR